MKPSWETLTVGQFLDLYRLSINTDIEAMTKVERAICIIYDMTERQVEEMTVTQFNDYAKQAAVFLNEKIPGKPVKNIRVGKKKYAICYDPTKLKYRQYVEIMTFGRRPIENMHLITASIVQPVTWYGRKLQNNADNHPSVSGEMLNARVMDVYHTCVFFCNLYRNLIINIQDSLVSEMMMKNMTKEEAEKLVQISIDAMDGFTLQVK
jgi:hypothetical protein